MVNLTRTRTHGTSTTHSLAAAAAAATTPAAERVIHTTIRRNTRKTKRESLAIKRSIQSHALVPFGLPLCRFLTYISQGWDSSDASLSVFSNSPFLTLHDCSSTQLSTFSTLLPSFASSTPPLNSHLQALDCLDVLTQSLTLTKRSI